MKYAQLRSMDVSNGKGIGVSLFTQGCPIRCEGCHNSSIWDFAEGKEYNTKTINKILKAIQPDWVERFSILGGEPLVTANLKELLILITIIKSIKPNIKIWIYTGYTYEQLQEKVSNDFKDYYINPILKTADVLVDGPFIQEKKDLTLKFKGSSNQRIIDLQKTAECGEIALLDV